MRSLYVAIDTQMDSATTPPYGIIWGGETKGWTAGIGEGPGIGPVNADGKLPNFISQDNGSTVAIVGQLRSRPHDLGSFSLAHGGGWADRDLALAPDGKHLYIADAVVNYLTIADVGADPHNPPLKDVTVTRTAQVLAPSPDGTYLYFGGGTVGFVSRVELATKPVDIPVIPTAGEVRGLPVSPDSKYGLVASENSN